MTPSPKNARVAFEPARPLGTTRPRKPFRCRALHTKADAFQRLSDVSPAKISNKTSPISGLFRRTPGYRGKKTGFTNGVNCGRFRQQFPNRFTASDPTLPRSAFAFPRFALGSSPVKNSGSPVWMRSLHASEKLTQNPPLFPGYFGLKRALLGGERIGSAKKPRPTVSLRHQGLRPVHRQLAQSPALPHVSGCPANRAPASRQISSSRASARGPCGAGWRVGG